MNVVFRQLYFLTRALEINNHPILDRIIVFLQQCSNRCIASYATVVTPLKADKKTSKIGRLFVSISLIIGLLINPIDLIADSSKNQYASKLVSLRKVIETTKTEVNIDETSKLNLLNLYFETEDHLEEIVALQLKLQISQNQLKDLPNDIKKLEKKFQKAEAQPEKTKNQYFSRHSNEKLVQRLTDDNIYFEQLNASIRGLEIQLAEQQKRPKQIREQLAETKTNKAKIEQKKTTLAIPKKNKKELKAYNNLIASQISAFDLTRIWLELDKSVTPLNIQAQKLELKLFHLQRKQLSSRIKDLENFLNEQRELKLGRAQTELIQAQQQSANKPSVIKKEILKNFQYNKLLLKVVKKQERYKEQKNEIDSRYTQLEKDFKNAETKINLAGLSPALGNLLREQRRNLPLKKDYQNEFNRIQNEIALASLELFQLEEADKKLADTNKAVQSRIDEYVSKEIDRSDILNIRKELQALLVDQEHIVLQLSSEYPEYSRMLAEVDFSLHQLVILGGKYKRYLDQRLLWVPSAPAINPHFIHGLATSAIWFSDISHWQKFIEDIITSLQASPFLAFAGLAVLIFQLKFRNQIKSAYKELLKKSSKIYSDQFIYTFYGLGYSFLLALPLAFLVVWLGWLILIHNQATHFSQAVAHGLLAASVPLLLISFFHQLFKPDGFVQILFSWKENQTQLFYKLLSFIRLIIVPMVFIAGIFANEAYSQHDQTLGRIALIIAMLGLFYMLHRLAHPSKGVAIDFYQGNSDNWISRMRYIWYSLLIIMPIGIIGFAASGYYQSALELQNKMVILFRLIFFTGLLHETVMRWLILANRQLALQNARQKRKLLEEAQDKNKDNEIEKDKEAHIIQLEEDTLFDIPKINEQSKKILRVLIATLLVVSIWLTLRDILPALAIFDTVELWQHMTLVNGKETPQSITVVNIFAVILYLMLVLVFVKNFPGLLDLIFAGRFSLTAGGRYALIQLTRYGVIALTIIAIANQLGGSWSQVQWLVAALSVGLGFGLQEIFANMVSGIILLFERPIRVGDTVTIGDIDGKVSRIQMRATTIVDWDQKELIVPNKSFITEKLVNWSLSDTITRIVIPVGVAYDSDVDQVKSLLQQVIAETPSVLKDPAPDIYFLEFGDSSLNFSVRVFIQNLDDRLPVMNDLHRQIKIAFDNHNIEIPFPQRDINLRTNNANFFQNPKPL